MGSPFGGSGRGCRWSIALVNHLPLIPLAKRPFGAVLLSRLRRSTELRCHPVSQNELAAFEAPEGATFARVEYEGREHRVRVRHGHFLLVVWNTSFRTDPTLVGFD